MQQTIVKYLREECDEQPPVPFVGSANGMYLGGGSKQDGARKWPSLKSTGCSAGYPDIFIHRRGFNGEIGLAVELKIGANRLSPAQKLWRDVLVAEGNHFAVVYSFEEFKSTLDEYLHGRARAPARPARSERSRSLRGTEELPLVLE